ncbi:TPA_asm: FtsK [Powellomyces chytrid fungus MELD virus 4]|nr:TPA_asm: FtsK [Powellomyces chytrid fungus MELD virus 4]
MADKKIHIQPLPSQLTRLGKTDKTDSRLPRKYGFVVYNGARFSGKTLNIAAITKLFLKKHYKYIVIITPNPFDNNWNPLRNSKKIHIFDEINNEILNDIHKEQLHTFHSSKGKVDLLLIIDDYNMQKGHKKALDKLATRGRHAGITCIVSSQYFYHNSPAIRSNCTNWIIYRPLKRELKKMVEAGLNFSVPEDVFSKFIMDETRKPFHFVHLNFQCAKKPFRIGFS